MSPAILPIPLISARNGGTGCPVTRDAIILAGRSHRSTCEACLAGRPCAKGQRLLVATRQVQEPP